MSTFQVVKTTGGRSDVVTVVDDAADRDDAVALARLHATEHATRLDLGPDALHDLPVGAAFVTNNGTPVRYEGVQRACARGVG